MLAIYLSWKGSCDIHVHYKALHSKLFRLFSLNCTSLSAPGVVSSRHVKAKGESYCGLNMRTSVVRMTLHLHLPATVSRAYISLPSRLTFLPLSCTLSVALFSFLSPAVPFFRIQSFIYLFLKKQAYQCITCM